MQSTKDYQKKYNMVFNANTTKLMPCSSITAGDLTLVAIASFGISDCV